MFLADHGPDRQFTPIIAPPLGNQQQGFLQSKRIAACDGADKSRTDCEARHPQVITKPIAVPPMREKHSDNSSVVGNTGAIESPAINTSTNAAVGLLVRSIRNVVTAMAIEAARVTVTRHPDKYGRNTDPAREVPGQSSSGSNQNYSVIIITVR